MLRSLAISALLRFGVCKAFMAAAKIFKASSMLGSSFGIISSVEVVGPMFSGWTTFNPRR